MVVNYPGLKDKGRTGRKYSSIFHPYASPTNNTNPVILKKISNEHISEESLNSIVGFRFRSQPNKLGFNFLWGLVSKNVEKDSGQKSFEIDVEDRTKFLEQVNFLSKTIVKNVISKADIQQANVTHQNNFVINLINEGNDLDFSTTIKSQVFISNSLMEDDSFHEANARAIITTLNSELRKSALVTFEDHLENLKNKEKKTNVLDSIANVISSNNDDGDAEVLENTNQSNVEKVQNLVEALRRDDQTIVSNIEHVKTLSASLKTKMSGSDQLKFNILNTGNNAHIRIQFDQLVTCILNAVKNTSIVDNIVENIEKNNNFTFSDTFKNLLKEKILNQSNNEIEHETASAVIKSILSPINNGIDTINSFFKTVFIVILFIIVIFIILVIFFFFRK